MSRCKQCLTQYYLPLFNFQTGVTQTLRLGLKITKLARPKIFFNKAVQKNVFWQWAIIRFMDEWLIWLGRITIYNCKSQCLLAAHWSDSWTRFFLSNLLSCFYLACLNEMYTWTPGSTQDRFMLLACHEHIFSFQFVTLHLIATFIKAVSFISRVSLGTSSISFVRHLT